MTNNFIEHLIIRSIKKTTPLTIKPALTPDALPEIFQLPPNYKQHQHYTQPQYSQTDTITQKQNTTTPIETPNVEITRDEPPQQSIHPYPQTQKPHPASQEPLNSPKKRPANSTKEETKPNPQDPFAVPSTFNAPKTDDDAQKVITPTPASNPQDSGNIQTDSTTENNTNTPKRTLQKNQNLQNLPLNNTKNKSLPPTILTHSKGSDQVLRSHEDVVSSMSQTVNSVKPVALTNDPEVIEPSGVAVVHDSVVSVESVVERSVSAVPLRLVSEEGQGVGSSSVRSVSDSVYSKGSDQVLRSREQGSVSEQKLVDSSKAVVVVDSLSVEGSSSSSVRSVSDSVNYEGLRPDLVPQEPPNSPKYMVFDSTEEKITQDSSEEISGTFLAKAPKLDVDTQIIELTNRELKRATADSIVGPQKASLQLAPNKQTLNEQSVELASSLGDRWNSAYPPKEPLPKIPTSAQTNITEKNSDPPIDAEQTHTNAAVEINPATKPIDSSFAGNFEDYSLKLADVTHAVLEHRSGDFSEKISNVSLGSKSGPVPLVTAQKDVIQTSSPSLEADSSLDVSENIVEPVSQPKTPQPIPSLHPVSLVSPKPLPSPIAVTPLNIDTQNIPGELRAKPPKPVLPMNTLFSAKVQSPSKEPETTVTIHIGRIEVHAVRAPEPPVELPPAPVLSLSDYLKQRSEKN